MRYDRDDLLARTDLRDLADELLGPRTGTARSGTWPCPNPHHAQTGRTPPVTVFEARTGHQRWHCHGCGTGGTAIDLLVATRGLTVREALDHLAHHIRATPTTPDQPSPPRRRRAPPQRDRPVLRDPEGLARYVDDCAHRLFTLEGREVLRWLTETRGFPPEVLRRNRVGADVGRRRQARPDGIPRIRTPAAVFPAISGDHPVFAQLRLLRPRRDGPRYLNAASHLATNPRVALYQPRETRGPCVIVSEGPTDALSAATGGFAAAAVLGTGAASEEIADRLARLQAPLAIAFDPDPAGDQAAVSLLEELRHRGCRAARLHVPAPCDDLNAWMDGTRDWPETLAASTRRAIRSAATSRRVAQRR